MGIRTHELGAHLSYTAVAVKPNLLIRLLAFTDCHHNCQLSLFSRKLWVSVVFQIDIFHREILLDFRFLL